MEKIFYMVLEWVVLLLGGLFTKFAIDSFIKKNYFLFGVMAFTVFHYMICIIYCSLHMFEVI